MKNQFIFSYSRNAKGPFIWTQKTRYSVHRNPQLVLILSQINLLHAFPT